jgi:hypothetical protein
MIFDQSASSVWLTLWLEGFGAQAAVFLQRAAEGRAHYTLEGPLLALLLRVHHGSMDFWHCHSKGASSITR